MSLITIQDLQTQVETVGATITNLYLINKTFNSRKREPASGPFCEFRIFDSEQSFGVINGAGTQGDKEVGNLIMEFFDDIDQGQRLYTMADTFQTGLKTQFDSIIFEIFRVENIGIVERTRGEQGGKRRNSLHANKGLYKISLRGTFRKYFT